MIPRIKVLKVNEPYAALIAAGAKPWELHRQPTRIRERIAIASIQKRHIVCFVDLIGCEEKSLAELAANEDKHRAGQFLKAYAGDRETLFAWILNNPVKAPPLKYTKSTGKWCFLQ